MARRASGTGAAGDKNKHKAAGAIAPPVVGSAAGSTAKEPDAAAVAANSAPSTGGGGGSGGATLAAPAAKRSRSRSHSRSHSHSSASPTGSTSSSTSASTAASACAPQLDAATVYVAELASAGNNNGPIALHEAAALSGSPAVAIGADGGVGLMHGVGVLPDGLPGVGVGVGLNLGLGLPLGMGLPMAMGSLLAVSAGGGLAGVGSGAVPGVAPMAMGMGLALGVGGGQDVDPYGGAGGTSFSFDCFADAYPAAVSSAAHAMPVDHCSEQQLHAAPHAHAFLAST